MDNGGKNMTTFNELYHRLVKASLEKKEPEELEKIRKEEFDPHHLACLLNRINIRLYGGRMTVPVPIGQKAAVRFNACLTRSIRMRKAILESIRIYASGAKNASMSANQIN
jgi:hypothetical protein